MKIAAVLCFVVLGMCGCDKSQQPAPDSLESKLKSTETRPKKNPAVDDQFKNLNRQYLKKD